MSNPTGSLKPVDVAALPKHFDAKTAEPKWLARWAELGAHDWDPSRPRDETFVVDTPPPTVSGMKTCSAVRDTTSSNVPRFSWEAVMSRKHNSSPPPSS